MHKIEILVHKFLQDVQAGKASISPELYDKFEKECRQSLVRQIEPRDRGFTLRMSNLGRPLCQLQFEQLGIPGDYIATDIIRNLYGDLTEKTLMFLLYASGVPIIEEQKSVTLDIAGTRISGTLDIVTNFGGHNSFPEVWDIKSASEWTFKNKFNKTFEEILQEDTFGYGAQLFLYAEAYGCKVGGLVIFNKSSSEIRVIEAPREQRSIRKRILESVEAKIKALLENDRLQFVARKTLSQNIQKQFEPVEEIFYKKPTGNLLLPQECTFCPWKMKCWENLVVKPKANSKAKNVEMKYYVQYKDEK